MEDEKFISQIVVSSSSCDQNGDRVSKKDKICHICSMRLKGVSVRYDTMLYRLADRLLYRLADRLLLVKCYDKKMVKLPKGLLL